MKARTSNIFSKPDENEGSFLRRFYIYQNERFPFLGHGLLVSAFSFSAISYSRICRGVEGFIPLSTFLIGTFTTITLFLLVRIFDEFKDAEDDAKYRKELPVPRGLISLKELMVLGITIAGIQIGINLLFFPKILLIYFVIIAYLSLMGKEFFIGTWLKRNQFWYVTSHMFIIPLVDIYASGLDWLLAGVRAPLGLLFFFAVSYMNGIVLEIGRKIRIPEKEAEGVLTYTSMLGIKRAVILWIGVLFITLTLSLAASHYAGYGELPIVILGSAFLLYSLPAWLFLKNKSERLSKAIEYASGLWTITMYLTLGGIPMLTSLLFGE